MGFPSWGSFQGQVTRGIMNSSSTSDLAWVAWSGEGFPMMRKFSLRRKMKFEMTQTLAFKGKKMF